jgi:hypothetical protein
MKSAQKLKYIFSWFLCLSFLLSIKAKSQNNDFDKIIKLFDSLYSTENMYAKNKINDSILFYFENFLNDSMSFYYEIKDTIPFTVAISPDKKLKIISWYVDYSFDDYKYFGFVQYIDNISRKYRLYKLFDTSDKLSLDENSLCSDTNWYGALYYKIIQPVKINNDFYTLLGYDFNSQITRKKIIDILTIKPDHLLFGKPVFDYNNRIVKNRIIFEYSSKAVMSMIFDEKNNQIVFDHLGPSKPLFEGHYEYYGPDMTFDAFRFENERWKYYYLADFKGKKQPKKKRPKIYYFNK